MVSISLPALCGNWEGRGFHLVTMSLRQATRLLDQQVVTRDQMRSMMENYVCHGLDPRRFLKLKSILGVE